MDYKYQLKLSESVDRVISLKYNMEDSDFKSQPSEKTAITSFTSYVIFNYISFIISSFICSLVNESR